MSPNFQYRNFFLEMVYTLNVDPTQAACIMSCLSPMFLSFLTREPVEGSKQRLAGKTCTFLRPIVIFITWRNYQFHEHFSLRDFRNFKNGF